MALRFRRSFSSEELEKARLLTRFRLFEDLSTQEAVYLIPFLFLREYRQDEVVYFREDPSQALYLIKSGYVALSLDLDERMEHLATRKPYESFGDNALLPATKRINNAIVSSEKAEIFVVPQANLLTVLDRHPAMKAKVHSAMCTIYNEYVSELYKTYRANQGFFDLSEVHFRK